MLWAAMVFFLVAIMAARLSRLNVALIASNDRDWRGAVSAGSRALARCLPADTAWRAAVRGRIFSAWNMLAYGVGIVLALWLDRMERCAPSRPRLSQPVETARSDAIPARCGALIPCAHPSRPRRPSSISASAISLPAIGLDIERGDDVVADQDRQREITEAPLLLWHIGFETVLVIEEQMRSACAGSPADRTARGCAPVRKLRRGHSQVSPVRPNAPACRRLRARPAPAPCGGPGPRSSAGSPPCAAHRGDRSNPGSRGPARAARGRADRR